MIMDIMPDHRPARKLRRTFTLTPENLAFIEQQTRRRKLPSQSAFLDQLLSEKTREQRLAELEANVTAYYDSLTDEEVAEQRAWGHFAEQTLVLNEEELAHVQSAARRNMVHETADRSSRKRKAPGRHRLGQRSKQSSAS
jgi:uncharacterized protein YbcV (DUF1398 family)